MGLWEPIIGFGLYRSYFNAIGVGIFSAGLIALAIHLGRGEKGWAAVGGVVTLLGLGALFPLISSTVNPQPRAAPIHDITTDTANPPALRCWMTPARVRATRSNTAVQTWHTYKRRPIPILRHLRLT
jgi:hypothetical protein